LDLLESLTKKSSDALDILYSSVDFKNRVLKYKMPEITVGSKAQVFHGTAAHTSGGLTKSDLVQNKHGRIVSRKKMMQGKKALKYLTRKGYKAKKGTFRLFNKHRRISRRQQGGFF
jgi:hypothetical protein